MRRILGMVGGALGLSLLAGGAAALAPLIAALGAGLTFTLLAVGIAAWRSIRRAAR